MGYLISNQYYWHNRKTRDQSQTSNALRTDTYEVDRKIVEDEIDKYVSILQTFEEKNASDCSCDKGMNGVHVPGGRSSHAMGEVINNFDGFSDLKKIPKALTENDPSRILYTSIGYAQIQIINFRIFFF